MKKVLLIITAFSIYQVSFSQTPDDAVRYSWLTSSGTARVQALGGASGAIGGEISTIFSNPANIGFYKTGDFVISGGANINSNVGTYFGAKSPTSKNSSGFLGTTGVVFGKVHYNGGSIKSSAFGIAVNKTADFNNTIRYNGRNTRSSLSEKFIAEASSFDGNFVANGGDQRNPMQFGPALALNTYYIDYDKTTNKYSSNASLIGKSGGLDQDELITTRGGISDIAIAGAANVNDKFYFGGTISLPVLKYSKARSFIEMDPDKNNRSNGFDFARFDTKENTSGMGINAKLGVVIKPVEMLRFGLSFQTPTVYSMRDTYWSWIKTDREGYKPDPKVNNILYMGSDDPAFNGNGAYDYKMVTPYKLMGSFALMFGQINNVSTQRGFLTGDIEYVNHKATRFSTYNDNLNNSKKLDDLNTTIKNIYKGALNARLGLELKFNTIMARLGGAYYGNPYIDFAGEKGSLYQGSTGLGYRNKGFFVDLGYVYSFGEESYYPYRLSGNSHPATIQNNNSRVVLTLGFKI